MRLDSNKWFEVVNEKGFGRELELELHDMEPDKVLKA